MPRYGRVYKDDMEKEMRFKIFKDNLAYIEAFDNARNRAYKLSVSGFADQTNEEFKAIRNRFKFPSNPALRKTTPFSNWSFSKITAMEGITQLTMVVLHNLGLHHLDNNPRVPAKKNGFAFIVKNKGINNDAAYPYEAEDATCNTKEESIHAAKITRQEDVPAEYDFKFYSSGVFNGYCGFTLTRSWVWNQ
ncbi:senescence-specific cysteine protease SAG39-like protein [Tanacetum coccineum]